MKIPALCSKRNSSQVEGRHLALEEYARRMIHDQLDNIGEIAVMLQKPVSKLTGGKSLPVDFFA